MQKFSSPFSSVITKRNNRNVTMKQKQEQKKEITNEINKITNNNQMKSLEIWTPFKLWTVFLLFGCEFLERLTINSSINWKKKAVQWLVNITWKLIFHGFKQNKTRQKKNITMINENNKNDNTHWNFSFFNQIRNRMLN